MSPAMPPRPPAESPLALKVLGRRGETHGWLRVTPGGAACPEALQLDKYEVAARTGVPLRDLRLLEPGLAATSATALLPRQRALLVSLTEHLKFVVTPTELLAPDSAELDEARQGGIRCAR